MEIAPNANASQSCLGYCSRPQDTSSDCTRWDLFLFHFLSALQLPMLIQGRCVECYPTISLSFLEEIRLAKVVAACDKQLGKREMVCPASLVQRKVLFPQSMSRPPRDTTFVRRARCFPPR